MNGHPHTSALVHNPFRESMDYFRRIHFIRVPPCHSVLVRVNPCLALDTVKPCKPPSLTGSYTLRRGGEERIEDPAQECSQQSAV